MLKKSSINDTLFNICNITILLLFTILTLYPFYYVLIYSLSIPNEAIRGVYLLPRGFTFINYIRIFTDNNLYSAFLVSVSRTVLGALLTVACSSMFAYGISKKILPFRRLMYRGLIITMYFSVGIIPWYVTMKMYGLKNNFLLYILPYIIVAFYVILLKTFFENLPQAVEESAMIDGAGYFRIFWRIIMPLSKPILATVALYSAVGHWNTWFDNFLLVPSQRLRTLPYVLYIYLNSQSIKFDAGNIQDAAKIISVTPTSIRITLTVIISLPIFLVYPFAQKYFIKGLLIGSIKG